MNRNIVHTLAFNLPSEVRKRTMALYAMNCNECFEHWIVDLGFPLTDDGDYPPGMKERYNKNGIAMAKHFNTRFALQTSYEFGSNLLKFQNVGVSQNWNKVIRELKIDETDIIVGQDPDERPLNTDWVKAMGEVMRADPTMALCSLRMTEQDRLFNDPNWPWHEETIGGHRVIVMECLINMALIGFSGKFLKEIGGIPVPHGAPVYGWIEQGLAEHWKENPTWRWCVMKDFYVEHLPCHPLYGEWKAYVVSKDGLEAGQPQFENWLLTVKKS